MNMKRKISDRIQRLSVLLIIVLIIGALPVISRAEDSVIINESTFPDEVFREIIEEYVDLDGDGVLSKAEIETVDALTVKSVGINSLTGIEYFTALEYLNCYGNKLTHLDVSKNTALKNLNCGSNQLTVLNIQNTVLETLACNDNKFTSLDISKNTALKELNCSWNQLSSLNIAENVLLEELNCSYNQLSDLDLSSNVALEYFYCNDNNIRSLDVTSNPELKWLHCYRNSMETLYISKCLYLIEAVHETKRELAYCVSYQKGSIYLYVDDTADIIFKSVVIDAANFPDETFREYIRKFDTDGDGKLNEAELANVTNISLSSSESVESLVGIEHFTSLKSLNCYNNKLTRLDLSKNTKLERLTCAYNQLTDLDLSKNTALNYLACYRNQLNNLNISNNAALNYLECYGNDIETLDISNCPKLLDALNKGEKTDYYEGVVYKLKNADEEGSTYFLMADEKTNVAFGKNGLIKDPDGKTRLYKNDEVVTSYIGLYEKEPGSNVFYGLKEGVWVENWEGLYIHSKNGRYYFLKDGIWQRGLNTLYKHSVNGQWYYLDNGIWQKGYDGLWQNAADNNKYYLLMNGLWRKGYDGLYVHSKNQWTYYIRDGIWNRVTEWYKHSQNGQTYYIETGLWRGTYKDKNGVQKKSTSVVVPK